MLALRHTSWFCVVLLGLLLVGCKSESACAPGNGKMCDIFSIPVKLIQEQPRLHFTDRQVTEGACQPPRCVDSDCTGLVLDGLFLQQELFGAQDASPPDTRCRYRISSVEGTSFDVLLTLVSSSPHSFCCNSGPRNFMAYAWTASANGVELDGDIMGFRLPSAPDAGVVRADGGTPSSLDATPDGPVDAPEDAAATVDAAQDGSLGETGRPLDASPLDAGVDVWPTALPSRQAVRFAIESQRIGWAVIAADRCGALSIERQESDGSWRSLVLGIPYQCGCECPAPLDFAGLQAVSSHPTLTWDARELAVLTEAVKCPTTPGHTQDIPVLRAFPQPVLPGHYRATASVLDVLPRQCTEPVDAGRPSCGGFCGDNPPIRCSLGEYLACPGDRTATAEFDLPASGDVDVRLLVN
jgi:hypothetical protein